MDLQNAGLLIIDDEVEICLSTKDMFQLEGYKADFVTTAKEAFEKFKKNSYGLLIVDIKLGGPVTGIEIIKSFREQRNRPKIIVISAIPQDALNPIFIREGISSMIEGFLNKPSCCNPEKMIGLAKRVWPQLKK